jgi:predicted amidophosphoribosyltransferase
MKCPRCQHENPASVKFCGECGVRLEALCPSCQAANPPTNKFCHACGASLVQAGARAATRSAHREAAAWFEQALMALASTLARSRPPTLGRNDPGQEQLTESLVIHRYS